MQRNSPSHKQRHNDAEPFSVERFPANWFACSAVPVGCIALVALLAMQISMNPRTVNFFVLLGGFVRSLPIALAIPPQSGEGVRHSGCETYNATPEEAASRVVADLFDQLSRGGGVSVHVKEPDGKEYMLEVTAKGQ